MNRDDIILEGKKITKKFGGLIAVNNVDFYLRKGEILGLIGPNGAGKSTFLKIISGEIKADYGHLLYNGENIINKPSYVINRMGIAKTNQIPRVFKGLSVLENVLIGVIGGKSNISMNKAKEKALYWLEFIGLTNVVHRPAESLQFVESKLVEIARALATEPKVLLLDEPLSGLIDVEINMMLKVIKSINHMGVSIIWVEHLMRAITRSVHRIIVLSSGLKIAEGQPIEVVKNPEVIKVYIGESDEHA